MYHTEERGRAPGSASDCGLDCCGQRGLNACGFGPAPSPGGDASICVRPADSKWPLYDRTGLCLRIYEKKYVLVDFFHKKRYTLIVKHCYKEAPGKTNFDYQ